MQSATFLNDPIQFINSSMERFGDSYTATLGINKKVILSKNAELINHILKENHKNYKKSELSSERIVKFFGNGLLFSNGEYWLRQRRLIQPAFHKEKLQGLYTIINTSINNFLATFTTGNQVNVYPVVHQLTFNVLIQSLFDINFSPKLREELNQIFIELQDFIFKDINQPFRKFFYPITGTEKEKLKQSGKIRNVFVDIVNERKKSKENFNDLLDMLLKSKYEDTGEEMSIEQIVDELTIIIFAGYETTANTLAWALHLLAENNTVTQNLCNIVDTTSIEDILQNEYIKAILSETMRMYPAAWMTERVAISTDTFQEISIPKNTIIIPFFFGLHRDANFWVEPNKFLPERFIDEPKLARSKNFIPFGAGPRMCIGSNFAMTVMQFFLFSFFKKFEIKSTGQIPKLKALITLRPDKVILEIKPRIID